VGAKKRGGGGGGGVPASITCRVVGDFQVTYSFCPHSVVFIYLAGCSKFPHLPAPI